MIDSQSNIILKKKSFKPTIVLLESLKYWLFLSCQEWKFHNRRNPKSTATLGKLTNVPLTTPRTLFKIHSSSLNVY